MVRFVSGVSSLEELADIVKQCGTYYGVVFRIHILPPLRVRICVAAVRTYCRCHVFQQYIHDMCFPESGQGHMASILADVLVTTNSNRGY